METVSKLLKQDMLSVEGEFRANLASDVELVTKVGDYILSSGGKRFRPMLVLLSSRLCEYSGDGHIGLAAAVEFLHTATLLHDDVVDSATLRRGNRSANSVWGNETSVLVGDYLFTKSFSMMVNAGNLEVLKLLADTTTRLTEGEIQQLVNSCDLEIDEQQYMQVIRDKTAILIAACCEIGAILASADEPHQSALHEFGIEIGSAFQLMDDTLDYIADQQKFGKERGHDLYEGKMTLPLIHTYAKLDARERQEVARIVDDSELAASDLEYVCKLIKAKGGIEYTMSKAVERIERAKQLLSIFPESDARQALCDLADYVVSRNR
jgi:octaprenyl-diphosphate synthase